MNRRSLLLMPVAWLAASLAAEAQQAGRVPRIGFLGTRSLSDFAVDAFRQGLRDLGWVEGQSIIVEYRFAEGRIEPLPELATELVRLKVDVLVAQSTPGATAAKHATDTIPIVMVPFADPVALGLVASLARPGGNVTGVSANGVDIVGKQLELLKATVPKVRRVAILLNPANPSSSAVLKNANLAARSLGAQLSVLEARDLDQIDAAFTAVAKERIEALLVMQQDTAFILHRSRFADLAAKRRLPAAYGWREHVEAGELMSYGASLRDMLRRSASLVDRILKGAKPADLPVEQPTKLELAINLSTARALGRAIPPSVLARADHVIE